MAGLLAISGFANLDAQTAPKTFKSPAVVAAQSAFNATSTAARKTYAQALDTAQKGAMGSGNLPEANAINVVRTAVDAGEVLPPATFKTAVAVQAKAVYESTVTKARAQYVAVLQANQKAILASGDLTEANKLQEEITEVTGAAQSTIAKETARGPVIESSDLLVTGIGFISATLEDTAQAWSNRGYLWQDVPESIKGWRYTKTNGGQAAEIKVRAKIATTVRVITDVIEPGTKLTGWSKAKEKFTTTVSKTTMQVFEKKLTAGQETKVPQTNWAGTLVLVPNK